MKFSFKVTKSADGSNKVFSTNISTLTDHIISEDGLNTAIEIAKHQNAHVTELLSHKVVYIAINPEIVSLSGELLKGVYVTYEVLVVRTKDGIKLFNDTFGYITIEDNDIAFTTEAEADEYAALKNKLDILTAIHKMDEQKIGELKELIKEF